MNKRWLFNFCVTLIFASPAFALVPGPILLTDEQLNILQKSQNEAVHLPQTRSGGACLKVESVRLCSGSALQKIKTTLAQLPIELQDRVFIYSEKERVKAILVFYPAHTYWSQPELQEDPFQFGPEAQSFESIRSQLSEIPVQIPFADIFPGELETQLMTWFYAEEHLGFVTQMSEAGEQVIGVFVTQ